MRRMTIEWFAEVKWNYVSSVTDTVAVSWWPNPFPPRDRIMSCCIFETHLGLKTETLEPGCFYGVLLSTTYSYHIDCGQRHGVEDRHIATMSSGLMKIKLGLKQKQSKEITATQTLPLSSSWLRWVHGTPFQTFLTHPCPRDLLPLCTRTAATQTHTHQLRYVLHLVFPLFLCEGKLCWSLPVSEYVWHTRWGVLLTLRVLLQGRIDYMYSDWLRSHIAKSAAFRR